MKEHSSGPSPSSAGHTEASLTHLRDEMVGCEPGDALCSEGRRKIFMKEGGCICSDLQDSVMFFTKANFQTPVLPGLWFVPLRRHITDLGTPSGDTVSR